MYNDKILLVLESAMMLLRSDDSSIQKLASPLLAYASNLSGVNPKNIKDTLAREFPLVNGLNLSSDKIPMIKRYRELVVGSGLKEAKDWIENNFGFTMTY